MNKYVFTTGETTKVFEELENKTAFYTFFTELARNRDADGGYDLVIFRQEPLDSEDIAPGELYNIYNIFKDKPLDKLEIYVNNIKFFEFNNLAIAYRYTTSNPNGNKTTDYRNRMQERLEFVFMRDTDNDNVQTP